MIWWGGVILLLMIVAIPSAFAENESIIKITDSLTDSTNPSLAISGSNIYLVWTELTRNGGHEEMFFSKSNDGGETFSQPKNILSQKGTPIVPIIATDGKTLFITWTYRYPDNYSKGMSDDNSEILFSKSTDGGNTFSEPVLISDKETFSSLSKMVVDGENVFITWFTHSVPWKSPFKSTNEIFFSKSTDGGETFGEPINQSNNEGLSARPNIAVYGSEIFLVWQDDLNNNTGIFFAKSADGGETFSDALNISKDKPYSVGSYITYDGSNILVTWASHKEGKDPEIFFSKSMDGGKTFGEPKNISNTSGYSILSPIVSDGKNIFVAWGDSKSNTRSILLVNSTDGGETFSKPVTISNIGVSDSPSIVLDGENVYAAWSNQKEMFKDPYEIYFSKIPIRQTIQENEAEDNLEKDKMLAESQKDQAPNHETLQEDNPTNTLKEIKWLDENGADYTVGGIGVIRLDDNDLNLNKTLIDIPQVHVQSDTDKAGIPVDIIETGVDTGVFYADINLSGGESSHLQLHVSNGDTMTVSFEDAASGLFLDDSIKIFSKYIPPLKQIKSGIMIEKIQCKEGLELIIRSGDHPSCVKPETIPKLVERGIEFR